MNIKRKANSQFKKDKDELIKPLFDIQTLDYYCRYIISENKNIKTSGLNLVRELFSRVDISSYNDPERINRINFIKRGIEARLTKRLTEKKLIIQYINGGFLDKPLLDVSSMDEISDETLAYLNEQAAELSKSYFVEEKYDEIIRLATDLKNSNYVHRSDIVNQIQTITSELNMKFNRMDDSISSETPFSLLPGEFEDAIAETHARETSPSRVLRTGMVALDNMLDGGFQSSRVYLLLALAAGGKSFTMLDIAMQIKNYNRTYKPHDPTKIPTIVFITMENSRDENTSRMLGMVTGGDKFIDYTVEASQDILRGHGLGYDPVTDPIDLYMIYKPNLSVNTDYLYALTEKLKETGREPICIFQDHIKRIRPVNSHNDMRLDLGEIVNEFKSFANAFQIPVITDSHLNRDASRILDANSENNKKDLIRSLGSSNVSESYLMIDNCDLCIIINKEYDSAENLYMGFKCIKTRTKCDLDTFFQPYEYGNPIKLMEDINDPTPAFKRSLDDSICTDKVMSRYDISRDEDSDNFFGESNMSKSTAVDSTLLPDNNNQQSFISVGQPSNREMYQSVMPEEVSFYHPQEQLTEWEMKLNELRLDPHTVMGIVFLDDDGKVIHDAIEKF